MKTILGTHAAAMELKILKFANLKKNQQGFDCGALDRFKINPQTGRFATHPDEKWNHVTDWRLMSALDDLVRYEFMTVERSIYQITPKGIAYLETIKKAHSLERASVESLKKSKKE